MVKRGTVLSNKLFFVSLCLMFIVSCGVLFIAVLCACLILCICVTFNFATINGCQLLRPRNTCATIAAVPAVVLRENFFVNLVASFPLLFFWDFLPCPSVSWSCSSCLNTIIHSLTHLPFRLFHFCCEETNGKHGRHKTPRLLRDDV